MKSQHCLSFSAFFSVCMQKHLSHETSIINKKIRGKKWCRAVFRRVQWQQGAAMSASPSGFFSFPLGAESAWCKHANHSSDPSLQNITSVALRHANFSGHCPFNSVSAVCYRLFSSSCGRTHSIQHPPCLQNKARQGQTTFYEALPHRCLGFSLPPPPLSLTQKHSCKITAKLTLFLAECSTFSFCFLKWRENIFQLYILFRFVMLSNQTKLWFLK